MNTISDEIVVQETDDKISVRTEAIDSFNISFAEAFYGETNSVKLFIQDSEPQINKTVFWLNETSETLKLKVNGVWKTIPLT